MRVLFDQGVPAPLRRRLSGHAVDTVFERGWSNLQNGDLLDIAEQEGYDVVVTTNQSLQYQQNFTERHLTIVVLLSTSWPRIQRRIDDIQDAVDHAAPGDYREILI